MKTSKDIRKKIGRREEDRVFEAVSKLPDVKVYRNVYIPFARGQTAEIDILLLSYKGLWAIEVKALSGAITGSVRRYEWTRRYKRNGSRPEVVTKLYNPIKQSDGHLKAIQRHLGIPAKHTHGIVAFNDKALLKKAPRTPSCTVLNTRYLSGYLRRCCLANRAHCFSPAEFSRIEQRLDALITSDAIECHHIRQVKQAEAKRKQEQQRRRASRKR